MQSKWFERARICGFVVAIFWGGRAAAGFRAVEIPEVDALFTEDRDLPGRRMLFANFMDEWQLSDLKHQARTPMMDAINDLLTRQAARERREIAAACEEALDDRSDGFLKTFNDLISEYLERRGVDNERQRLDYLDDMDEVDHVDFRTLVATDASRASWIGRLANRLAAQSMPVKLYVLPRLFARGSNAVEFSVNRDGLAIHMSPLSVLSFAISIMLEHEIFHNLQMQARQRGEPDAWPDQNVHSTNPSNFHGRARRYVEDIGYFSIEEIGASTRDAIQIAGSIASEQKYRLAVEAGKVPETLIERERKAALSFAKGASRIYRQALLKLARGELRREDLRQIPEDGATAIPVTPETYITMYRFAVDDRWRDHVREQLSRGLTWISAYRRYLVRPAPRATR